MDTRLIYISSEKCKQKIEWIKPGETEWQYCGTAGEIKWNLVTDAITNFFDGNRFFVADTRTGSFETDKDNLVSSIRELIGSRNFLVWSEDFTWVMEFNQIGVFRRGVYNANAQYQGFRMSYKKISPGSSDKVNGKPIKYRKGDCLSLDCGNKKYLAAFVAEKFNKYYDFTLLEYYDERKPVMEDFINGRFFGCYGEVEDQVCPATERLMLPCLGVDANPLIEKTGSLELIDPLEKSSYGNYEDIATILQHYREDLPKRRQNTENFEKLPNHLFISSRLIEMKQIISGDG